MWLIQRRARDGQVGFATAEAEVTEEAIGVQERELRRVRQWGNEGKMGGSCRRRAEEGGRRSMKPMRRASGR